MLWFADTSFISALFVSQANSPLAIRWLGESPRTIVLGGLVPFEFRQAVRLQVFRHKTDRTVGFGPAAGAAVLNRFDAALVGGILRISPTRWDEMVASADRLSGQTTSEMGNRTVDILNVAAALQCAADGFLSFDKRQRSLAVAAGLTVGPADL